MHTQEHTHTRPQAGGGKVEEFLGIRKKLSEGGVKECGTRLGGSAYEKQAQHLMRQAREIAVS